MRYERKYKVDQFSPDTVRQVVVLHPASFRMVYPDRRVNNIYFDTASLTAYQENVDGVPERRKFRVRWYGDNINEITKPKLEIKIKSNQVGTKESYPVDAFSLNDLTNLSKIVSEKTSSMNILQPTLVNSYLRSYYETLDRKYRITIDRELKYFCMLNARHFTRFQIEEPSTILELKYDESLDDSSDFIFQHIPFRFSKSSKYVSGLELIIG